MYDTLAPAGARGLAGGQPLSRPVRRAVDGEYREYREYGEYHAYRGRGFDERPPPGGTPAGRADVDADVDAAVQAARAALSGPWGGFTVARRVEILRAAADAVARRFDDFLAAEAADTGKPVGLASRIDPLRDAANFRTFADVAKHAPGDAIRRPVGVIAVICPWHLPLRLLTWKVGPALACGNTAVVKPSEDMPQTAALLGDVMNAAGVPRGVYNLVRGFGPGSAGECLATHPGVNEITFTGETLAGSRAASPGAGLARAR